LQWADSEYRRPHRMQAWTARPEAHAGGAEETHRPTTGAAARRTRQARPTGMTAECTRTARAKWSGATRTLARGAEDRPDGRSRSADGRPLWRTASDGGLGPAEEQEGQAGRAGSGSKGRLRKGRQGCQWGWRSGGPGGGLGPGPGRPRNMPATRVDQACCGPTSRTAEAKPTRPKSCPKTPVPSRWLMVEQTRKHRRADSEGLGSTEPQVRSSNQEAPSRKYARPIRKHRAASTLVQSGSTAPSDPRGATSHASVAHPCPPTPRPMARIPSGGIRSRCLPVAFDQTPCRCLP
jgi:hypothetical protein